MQVNDKSLTVATGACLAIGVAIAGFVLGSGEEARTDHIELASSVIGPKAPETHLTQLQIPAPPPTPTKSSSKLVFASLELVSAHEQPNIRLGMAESEALTIAPELVALAQGENSTRSKPLPTPAKPERVASLAGELRREKRTDTALGRSQVQNSKRCSVELTTLPKAGARIGMTALAPCHEGAEVTVSYSGLQFRERLSQTGRLELTLPAFVEFSRINVSLDDGTQASVGVYVSGLQFVERAGISWRGKDDTFLHAYEGAGESAQHRWRLSPGSARRSRMDGGGYLTLLGDPLLDNPRLAQIYTIPSNLPGKAKFVRLVVETLRNRSDCGGELNLWTARHSPTAGHTKRTTRVQLSDCGEERGSLTLKNIVKDLRIALN